MSQEKIERWNEVDGNLDNGEKLQAFLDSTTDAYAILQLRRTDETVYERFESYEALKRQGKEPNIDHYDVVYVAPLSSYTDQTAMLEGLYTKFNVERPEDFRGHSLSVSDIVALKTDAVVSFHYVDSIGFQELQGFMKPENYLKNAEMAMEDDYGMLDGVINNGKAPATEERSSVLAQLKEQPVLDSPHKPPKARTEREMEFTVVLYRDEQGNTIPQDFLSELDPPPKGFRVEDAPVIDLEEEAPSVDEAEESPFVAQVMRDVEAIAAEEESYERFSVIETENGYAVWDDIRDEIYVDDEGVSEEFTSEWQANDYLQEVKKAVSAKESAEWLYNERSKFEATQEPVYQVGDTVFLEGEAYNITAIGTTDVQLLPPGMVYPIYRAESKENFERLLRQDERNARFISGEEPEKTVATAEPEHFIDHYYVVEDLQVRGALQLKEYSTFEDAMRAYKSLPSERMKALGVQNTRTPFPGSLDLIQCKDGEDKLVQDYTKVAGWENPEILDLVQKIETAIQTKESPDIPAINFHITNDHLGEGGAKAKFRANMDAIRVLKELEFDERNATPEEQEILSQYVGWGGLAAAFDENKASWAEEFRELYTALSPEEYAAARASTLNAHYTSPTVIRAIYDAVGQMGFETGNILEPAMGIGNFFGIDCLDRTAQ